MLSRFLLALLVTFGAAAAVANERPSNVRELLQGEENERIIREAEKVEVCSLRAIENETDSNGKETLKPKDISHEEMRTNFVTLNAEDRVTVVNALLSESSYGWNIVKGCLPFYHLRALFHRGADVIAADFCFGCEIVQFSRNGKDLGGEDFDAISGQLFSIFSKTFPEDPVFKALKKHQEKAKSK